jgi:5-methyltetrahydrofolate--homocysteine methyltransferase
MGANPQENLYQEIVTGLLNFNPDQIKRTINDALESGMDPLSIQENGLRKGLEKLGELFESEEIFIPHLMLGAKIFNESIKILKPHIVETNPPIELGTAVIGTVMGDLHDLGKNMVTLLWSVAGFNVIDLGINVSTDEFLKAIREYNPKLLGLSSLLTTTMLEQKKVIKALVENNLRDSVKVIVGGAPVTEKWAMEIGADSYGKDAAHAVKEAKRLIKCN